MNSKEILKSLRINHIFSLFAALLVIAAFETGIIAEGGLNGLLSSTWKYVTQVTAVMLTVLLIPLALKGFTNKLEKSTGRSEEEYLKIFVKKSMHRMSLLFIVLLLNTFVHYGIGYNGSLYCGLFALGTLAYSYPTRMVLEEYLEKNRRALKEQKN